MLPVIAMILWLFPEAWPVAAIGAVAGLLLFGCRHESGTGFVRKWKERNK
jgi:hypothetical protein